MPDTNDDTIPTRRSLLSRLKNWDDHQSWQTFFDTYWKLIYSVALKAGLTDAEAQDVVQETVVTVAKQMQGFKYDPALGSFKGWLLHTARWKIADQLRKRLPVSAPPWPASDDASRTPTVERVPDPNALRLDRVWDEEWEENLRHAALERLKRQVNAKDYQIFDCYVLKQWTVEEVMSTLGVIGHSNGRKRHG